MYYTSTRHIFWFYSAEIGPNDADDCIPPSDECCCASRTLESCLIIRSRFGTTVVAVIPFIARNHRKEWADFKAGPSCASSVNRDVLFRRVCGPQRRREVRGKELLDWRHGLGRRWLSSVRGSYSNNKGKGKGCPRTGHKGPERE